MKELSAEIKFIELTDASPDKLSVASMGEQGSGKTRFGATYPSPIGIIPLDRKTRYSIGKTAVEMGKKVIMPSEDLIRLSNPMELAMMKDDCGTSKTILWKSAPPTCCSTHFYRWHVNRIKETAFKLAEMPDSKCRSIIVDSGSQLSEDILYACYGRTQKVMPRDRGMYNQEMIDFLNAISNKHVLITHKAKEVWVNEKPVPGEFKRKGFGEIGYHCNVEIEHYRGTKGKKLKKPADGEEIPFYIDVRQCQANPSLVGETKLLENEQINFQTLAMLVFPDSDSEDWE